MASKKLIARLEDLKIVNRGEFGRQVVRLFTRVPEDYRKKFRFDDWAAVYFAADARIEDAEKRKVRPPKRFTVIRTVAFQAMRTKLRRSRLERIGLAF